MLQVVWVPRARRQRFCGAQDPQGELEGRGVGEGPHHAAQGQDCGVPGWHLHPGHGHEGGQGQSPPLPLFCWRRKVFSPCFQHPPPLLTSAPQICLHASLATCLHEQKGTHLYAHLPSANISPSVGVLLSTRACCLATVQDRYKQEESSRTSSSQSAHFLDSS